MLYMQEMGAFSNHQPCPPATFSCTNPLNISEIWTATKFWYFNATDLKLGSSTYFFLLFPFLVFAKSQVLNLRMGSVTWAIVAFKGLSIRTWESAGEKSPVRLLYLPRSQRKWRAATFLVALLMKDVFLWVKFNRLCPESLSAIVSLKVRFVKVSNWASTFLFLPGMKLAERTGSSPWLFTLIRVSPQGLKKPSKPSSMPEQLCYRNTNNWLAWL